MCDPVSGMLAASMLLNYQQTKENNEIQRRNLIQTNANNNVQSQVIKNQIQEKTNQEISQRAKAAMVERARLNVSATQSNIYGAVVDRFTNQSLHNQGVDITTMEGNKNAQMIQADVDANAMASKIQGEINAIQDPSWLATGLQIGATALDRSDRRRGTTTSRVRSIDPTRSYAITPYH